MTTADKFLLAITAWRENRGGGRAGMQSVMNVVLNRAKQRGGTPYLECTRAWQFSSITAKGDPQLNAWPETGDVQFATATAMAETAADEGLEDITGGATSYYAASMVTPPYWARTMTSTVEIAGQRFFR